MAYRVDLIHKDLHNTHDQLWVFLDRMTEKYQSLIEKLKESEKAVTMRRLREKQIAEYFPVIDEAYQIENIENKED